MAEPCQPGSHDRRPRPERRGRRQGMTLVEVMVVMAILVVMAAVSLPTMNAIFDLEHRGAAKELAQTYTWLMDEAALRNVSFRVVYNLDRNTWKLEVGDPNTVVFANPEDREKAEEELADKMKRYTKREIEAGEATEAGEEGEEDEEGNALVQNQFMGLEESGFTTENELPGGTRFAFVYTPQYGEEGVQPSDEPSDDPEEDHIAYTYIFPDGTAEHTVVRIVDVDDPSDGYSIEVEPLSGQVRIDTEISTPKDSLAWLPDEGPELQQ